MADHGQKTEQPTPRRLQKARREGNFAVSREFVAGLQFLAVTALLVWSARSWFGQARRLLRALLEAAFEGQLSPARAVSLIYSLLSPLALPLAGAGAGLVALTALLQLGMTGWGLAPAKLKPDWRRLDPVARLRDLRRQNVPQFFQALLLLPLFSLAVWEVVRDNLPALLSLPLVSVPAGLGRLGAQLEALLWKAAALFVLLGLVDLYRQRRRYRRDLRMSKQDVREEMKELEGNPQVKMRIRRWQRDLLRRRMMREVPRATAVIVNPTHYAVAIRYRPEAMAAPTVVAKGRNYLARRIREIARQHQVPIVENPPLAQALYKSVEVGREIPVHFYRAVAEILAYIYRLTGGRMPG